MIETLLSYSNTQETVTFEVQSSKFVTIDNDACEQVWKVAEKIGITQGKFILFVNKKIPGQSTMNTAVKIVGSADRNPHQLYVKFQSSPGQCYEGSLSLRVEGIGMEYASRLKEKLKVITGDGWFDPKFPEVKKILPPLARTEIPIARVETALFVAATSVVSTPKGGCRNLGKASGTRIVPKALVPITMATARYIRLMKIRSDITVQEEKKSKIEAKIAELKKKAERKYLLEAEVIVKAAGAQLARS